MHEGNKFADTLAKFGAEKNEELKILIDPIPEVKEQELLLHDLLWSSF